MGRPWLKWEADLGASREKIEVSVSSPIPSGTVLLLAEHGPAIVAEDVAAGANAFSVIVRDAAVDVSALTFQEDASDEMRQELIAELARSRILDRK